ncbi:MAG: hypothetical protein HQK96_20555 [Nitrospirae bacterium]|nr:hypothetical protein [Nitrospirota bacterium]
MNMAIAISTSSTVGGFWVAETPWFTYFWKGFGTLTAIFSIVKPFLNYDDDIKLTKEALDQYMLLDNDFHNLSISIRQTGKYDDESKKTFRTVMDKKTDVIRKFGGNPIPERYITRAFEKVKKELPETSFYIPEV